MHTIKDLHEGGFSCFSHLDADERAAQKQAVTYIERMASLTSVDLSQVNLFDVFGNGSKKDRLIISKGDINKRLLDFSNQKEITSRTLTEAEEKVVQKLSLARLERNKRVINDHKYYLSSSLTTLENYHQGIVRELKKACEYRRKIADLENKSDFHFIENIRKIGQSSFWELTTGPSSESIYFKTRGDITLQEKNLAAGIDRQVNMGRYRASLQISDGVDLKVDPLENNLITSQEYYHPYVSSGGSVCWGNASGQATKLMVEGDFDELFSLLAALLSTYSIDATPYAELLDFDSVDKQLKQRGLPRGSRIEEEVEEEICESCENSTEDCDCFTCESCNYRSPDGSCPDHHCYVCSSDDRETCGCCQNCDRSEDNCTCCGTCNSSDRDSCGCCQECDRSERNLERNGHAEQCSAFVATPEGERI